MNKSNIVIGVYIDANVSSKQLNNVLFHLHINETGANDTELLLLLDQPNNELRQYISQLPHSSIELPPHQSGYVYYFNHLITQQADYYVFITCEMLLAPHSLAILLSVFTQDKQAGFAGPSSNNAWNQQSVYEDESAKEVNLLLRSQKLQQTFRPPANTESLHALLESCLVINRAVVEAIGYADEAFQKGYCWEVDYQQRAIQAGYDCIWAKNAYAHKHYLVDNSNRDNTLLENSRLLNQNTEKYTNRKKDYYLPPKQLDRKQTPLISCIMPTRGRADYVKQAIFYFSQQDYPCTELIIVYDSPTDLPKGSEYFDNVYYIKSPENSSIGHKRNMAVKQACGKIIAHWDDDDWYAKNRLSDQAKPILLKEAEITALYNTAFFCPSRWEAWKTSPELYKAMFVEGVHGGTLMYSRKILGDSQYFDISLREDAILLEELIRKNGRLAKVDGWNLFVYLRHNNNSWSFESGTFKDENGWKKIDIPALLTDDLAFYRQYYKRNHSNITPLLTTNPLGKGVNTYPKVSCIMPTKNRKEFVSKAIQHFLKQSYENKELIIVDDGDKPVDTLIPSNVSNIKYVSLNAHHSIGHKRNIANELASGDIIMHWDDDDWMAKGWISTQVNALLHSESDVTGITNAYYFDPHKQLAWLYSYPPSEKVWVLGGSLCYWRHFWVNNKFKHLTIGEDAEFLWTTNEKRITPHQEYSGYIGFVHNDNTSPKNIHDHYWSEVDPTHIKKLMSLDELS